MAATAFEVTGRTREYERVDIHSRVSLDEQSELS